MRHLGTKLSLLFCTVPFDSSLAETKDDEGWEKEFCSSGKTNSILSHCKPTKTDKGVASGVTERIGENFCTSRIPHASHCSSGQNEDKTFLKQTVTPSLLQKSQLFAGWLVANQKSTLKLTGNRSPANKSDFARSQAQGAKSQSPAPASLTLHQAVPERCPAPRQLPGTVHGLASTLAFVWAAAAQLPQAFCQPGKVRS